ATSSYWLLSGVNNNTAPFCKQRFTLLFISKGPVSQMPKGTTTTPPPLALQAVMALLIASVFNSVPLDTAPYCLILKLSFLKAVVFTCGNLFQLNCAWVAREIRANARVANFVLIIRVFI